MTTEKVIELTEVNKQPPEESLPVTTEQTIIEAKPVTKLTKEEKELIVNNFKSGNPQPNYTVTELKNGDFKITKSVNKGKVQIPKQNTENKVVEPKVIQPKFTNEQMLIHQIMELNSKLDILNSKQDKLKKKYKKIKRDIYVDADEFETEPVEPSEEIQTSIQKVAAEPNNNNNDSKPQFNYNDFIHVMTKPGNWRRKVKYV